MSDIRNTGFRASERGAVSIKSILMLVIAGVAVLFAVKLVPVYIEQRGVIYDVDELARVATVRGWKEDKITPEINKIRGKYELPEGSINFVNEDRNVKINIGYSRAVDLLVTTYAWKVQHTVTGKEI